MDSINKMQTTTQSKQKTVKTSLGDNPTIESDIPNDVVWIDDSFYIKKTRFGLYTSVLKEPILGANFITGSTEDGVLEVTRWHLKSIQEGTLDDFSRTINDGVVGGKL